MKGAPDRVDEYDERERERVRNGSLGGKEGREKKKEEGGVIGRREGTEFA